MFALPPLAALLIVVLARPLDLVAPLRGVPLLHILFVLTVFGVFLDARLGHIKLHATPQLPWALALLAIAMSSAAVMAPGSLVEGALGLAVVLALFLVVSHGTQHFKGLEVAAAAVLASSLWVSAVCVHQGLQPRTCVAVEQKDDHTAMGDPDERRCVAVDDCYVDPPEPQAIYRCEHAGIFGLTSIGNGRVRYLGVLHDPNEVAITVSSAVPLAAAFHQRRRSGRRLALLVATTVLAALTVVLSGSRTGLLVFAMVLAVYLLKRHGWRGVAGASLAAMPVLLTGGRSGAEAESSTFERVDAWSAGLRMVSDHPLLGVGYGQFTEHHPVTAHNAGLLVAGESGLAAAALWIALVYVSLKVPIVVLRDVSAPEAAVARTWALSLLASIAGIVVGAMFLSFAYHLVLWIYVGMSAALWVSVKRHEPSFQVHFGWRDLLLVVAASGVLLVSLYLVSLLDLG